MPAWTRVLGTVITVSLVAGTALYAFYGAKPSGSGIHTSGVIEGTEVNLASKVAGRIATLCCREGERVQRGQVVLRLESADLQASVAQAQGGLARAGANIRVAVSSIRYAKAMIDSATADIRAAQAGADKAEAERADAGEKLARARTLAARKFISPEALDTAATSYSAAMANYASAQSLLVESRYKKQAVEAQLATANEQRQVAQADLEQAQANLAYHQARLADTVIASPISGMVVFKALEPGETVSPGVTVLTVVDLASLYARLDVDETRVDKIALGSPATIRTEDPASKPIKGRVSEIGQYAGFATQRDMTRGRQDIKTFRVKVSFQDPAGLLKPGMTVEVDIAKRAEP